MSKSKFVSALIFFAILSTPHAQASSCPAANFILDAGAAFSSAARSGSPSAFTSAASHFTDLRGIALFALGSFRGNLSPAQEGKYVGLAKGFIGRFMADNASSLSGSNNLTITTCAANSVSARMASGGTVIFRLSGPSRIQDVNVSGIWVAQALRDKFTGVIRAHGGDMNALFVYLGQ